MRQSLLLSMPSYSTWMKEVVKQMKQVNLLEYNAQTHMPHRWVAASEHD